MPLISSLLVIVVAVLFGGSLADLANDSVCLLPFDSGSAECDSWSVRWHFDASLARCTQFKYSGCKGNSNNFLTIAECNRECTQNSQKWNADKAGQRGRCFLPKVTGPCSFYVPRFFFNVDTRLCEQFQYSGCAGNLNNFATEASCKKGCENPDVAPTTPMVMKPWWKDARCSGVYLGVARAMFPYMKCTNQPMVKFQYNRDNDKCEQVDYYGCPRVTPTMNLFEMMSECKRLCEKPPAVKRGVMARLEEDSVEVVRKERVANESE